MRTAPDPHDITLNRSRTVKVIDPGHVYELRWLDGKPYQHVDWVSQPGPMPPELHEFKDNRLIFVKREGEKFPGNVGHHPGTTMQEVLRVIINRIGYLNNQVSDPSNYYVQSLLREAIYTLEQRAARRHGRTLNLTAFDRQLIEVLDTCPKCMHIGCEGGCHADIPPRSQADGHTD